MAINRAQLAKELEPGLNALFGMEYSRYENEHAEIFDNETSDRAFEEEVMLVGFGEAAVKQEGSAVQFDTAQESFTARYTHETVALAFVPAPLSQEYALAPVADISVEVPAQIFVDVAEAFTVGNAFTVTDCEYVSLPYAFVAVNETVYVPEVVKVCVPNVYESP